MAELTIDQNKAEYCDRHEYRLDVVRRPMAKHSNGVHGNGITWTRMEHMASILETNQCDWAWAVGTDTMVTNMTIPLSSLVDDKFHVIIAGDWCAGVQADSFLVRNTKEGVGYLEYILSLHSKYLRDPWVENKAMVDTLNINLGRVKVLPQKRMNSYIYKYYNDMYPGRCIGSKDCYGNEGEWSCGDLLLHLPGLSIQQRMNEFKRVKEMVVR